MLTTREVLLDVDRDGALHLDRGGDRALVGDIEGTEVEEIEEIRLTNIKKWNRMATQEMSLLEAFGELEDSIKQSIDIQLKMMSAQTLLEDSLVATYNDISAIEPDGHLSRLSISDTESLLEISIDHPGDLQGDLQGDHPIDDQRDDQRDDHVETRMNDQRDDHVETRNDQRDDTASKLVQRFFPKATESLPVLQPTLKEDPQVQVLKKKVISLESEVFKLKELLQRNHREKDELERNLSRVKSSQSEFENYRGQEMARLKAIHDEEMKSLKRDKIAWEKQRKAADILPSKKERLEIEALKAELDSHFTVSKQKENRLLLSQDRLKKRLEESIKKNSELQDEIKILEQERAAFVELHRRQTKWTDVSSQNPPGIKTIRHEVVEDKNPEAVRYRVPRSNLPEPLVPEKNCRIEYRSDVRVDHADQRMMRKDMVRKDTRKESAIEKVALDELAKSLGLVKVDQQSRIEDGVERLYSNGTRLHRLSNGTLKQIRPDNVQIVYLTNKDQKTLYTDGKIVYWYTAPRTLQTVYPDGTEVFEFASGQIEKHYPDGRQDIVFPDLTKKQIHADGQEVIYLPDGRVHRMDVKGNRVMEHPDGFKEITSPTKVRTLSYADGTVRTIYPNGNEEICYPDGRVKTKS